MFDKCYTSKKWAQVSLLAPTLPSAWRQPGRNICVCVCVRAALHPSTFALALTVLKTFIFQHKSAAQHQDICLSLNQNGACKNGGCLSEGVPGKKAKLAISKTRFLVFRKCSKLARIEKRSRRSLHQEQRRHRMQKRVSGRHCRATHRGLSLHKGLIFSMNFQTFRKCCHVFSPTVFAFASAGSALQAPGAAERAGDEAPKPA